jgi:site-specific DNA-methyltransferase (adenine-specific)
MKVTDKITITNEDNMLLMARYSDNYFDLAIVDPPYGINMGSGHKGSNKRGDKDKHKTFAGNDTSIPNKEYFDELFRISKNQIIWGGNYMTKFLEPKSSWLIWDKVQPEEFSMAMAELAWSSFDSPIKIFKKVAKGGFLTNGTIDQRIHPTQKPVALYKWILDKYAKIKCDHKHEEHYRYLCTDCNNGNVKILDTHLGSGSIAIACHDYGFELTACELDKEYYDKAIQRIVNHTNQTKLF